MNIQIFKKNTGALTFELLISISIFSVMLITLSFAFSQFMHTTRDTADKIEALYLAEDVLEMVRFLRDDEWATIDSLTEDQEYYLSVTPSDITITGSPEYIGEYKRSFKIMSVWRDTDDHIVTTIPGNSNDDFSRYVIATVTWGSPERSVELTTILTDIKDL
jgi:type II secretory pathway pseudopilin PulG